MRTYQHIIDTKAVRQVLNAVPEHCVVRGLSERDYGIDLMIEFFSKNGTNKHGHDIFNSTGHVCYLQIKGTDSPLKINKDKTISCSIDKSFLLYAERFPTPIILTRVSTLKSNSVIYFLWIQRYISDELDIFSPTWRTDKQESLTVHIPTHNKLTKAFSKIEKISWRIKYLEELAEFHESFSDIRLALEAIINLKTKYKFFLDITTALNRLSNLSTLLSHNNCCIDRKCILDLIKYIKGVQSGKNIPTKLQDYPHNFNLDLLRTSNGSTRFIEALEAENEGKTVY